MRAKRVLIDWKKIRTEKGWIDTRNRMNTIDESQPAFVAVTTTNELLAPMVGRADTEIDTQGPTREYEIEDTDGRVHTIEEWIDEPGK